VTELLQFAIGLHPRLKPLTGLESPHGHRRTFGRCHHERESTILDFEPARVRERPMSKAAGRESDMRVHPSNRKVGNPVVVRNGYEFDLLPPYSGPLCLEPDGTIAAVEPVYRDPNAAMPTVVGHRRPDGSLVR